MSSDNHNFIFAGEVQPDGEVIKLAAAVADQNGGPVQRDRRGIYLLEHGQQFSLVLSNFINNRSVSMRITGDDDSTVIADDLILMAAQTNAVLKRWLSVDQAFIAYRRQSEEGDAVGGQVVSEGGGGLIRIIFTIGHVEVTRSRVITRSVPKDRSRNVARDVDPLESLNMAASSHVEEGVMGAGRETGQRFKHVTFHADPALPQFEIQLRWGIPVPAEPMAPPDRRVTVAPSIRK